MIVRNKMSALTTKVAEFGDIDWSKYDDAELSNICFAALTSKEMKHDQFRELYKSVHAAQSGESECLWRNLGRVALNAGLEAQALEIAEKLQKDGREHSAIIISKHAQEINLDAFANEFKEIIVSAAENGNYLARSLLAESKHRSISKGLAFVTAPLIRLYFSIRSAVVSARDIDDPRLGLSLGRPLEMSKSIGSLCNHQDPIGAQWKASSE